MQDTQIKVAIYKHFAETGRAPSASMFARLIGSDRESVHQGYARLRAQRMRVLQSDGESIRMAPPFSGVATQHVVSVTGKRYFANCAWDALGIPAACISQLLSIRDVRSLANRCAYRLVLRVPSHRPGYFTV
jgi:Alkylmercury lyase